mgnify:CR=1 FL=1
MFQDLMYTSLRAAGSSANAQNLLPTGLQIGAGAAVTSTERNNIQGPLVQTGNQLDVAIQGNGFFQIQLADGTLAYTRNGQFGVNREGYIVNDPNAKFVAQTDGTGLAVSAIGQTIGFVAGAGNTANGISTAYLDSTTLGTALEPFKVVDLIVAPPGSQGTLQNGQPYNYAVVQFNNEWTRAVN